MSNLQQQVQSQFFDDIDNLINSPPIQSIHLSEINSLKDTILQYQTICKRLSHTNQALQDRLEEYQAQMEQYQLQRQQFQSKYNHEHDPHEDEKTISEEQSTSVLFRQEYSTLFVDCNQMQILIQEYKKELQAYRGKMDNMVKKKDQKINQLKEDNRKLEISNQELRKKVQELQQNGLELEDLNKELMDEIQAIQMEMKRRQQHQNNHNNHKIQTPRYQKSPRQPYNHLQKTNQNSYYPRSHVSPKPNDSYYPQQISSSRSIPSLQEKTFNDNINQQYQKMIQKLIKELEYQKNNKKSVNNEIKRLQGDIVALQKEIMGKNQRIYALEIEALKRIKNNNYQNVGGNVMKRSGERQRQNNNQGRMVSSNVSNAAQIQDSGKRVHQRLYQQMRNSKRDHKNDKLDNPRASKQRDASQSRTNFQSQKRTFTLMQLTNNQITLSLKQKLTLALKLISLFQKKIKDQDYTFLILTSVSITHLSQPNRMIVKEVYNQDHEDIQEEYQKSEAEVIWNLGFLLDTLFNKTSQMQGEGERQNQFGSYSEEEYLNRFIGEIIQNRETNSLEHVMELERIVKNALKNRQ